MHIILTHERADFDAIASLLAAAKLYPDAVPLTPRDINQNVRDFLTLYWDELPFVEYGNRPRGKIEQITMVDSQYIPSVRGRSRHTRLRVIDHHAPGDHLLPETEATLVETGAAVTYLIEQITHANITVNPIHATLMLLGIYEDCGYLTYNNTTPRDARAAAWLLEHGARLDVLREFLNYPLNPAQTRLYHAIVNNLETQTIHGQQIMISAVQSAVHVDEISSLAHKLRDLYNPDGLFLLIGFDDPQNRYVQFIARSSTDAIHVGRIAEAFDGGGHPRAAAAHISGGNLSKIYNKLIKTLYQQTTPAPTVREIMSYRARTLSPQQSIQEAADMMTRYGHEGYPVVEDGKIAGILTRREIDIAMRHQLSAAPIQQVMLAGEIYVTPDDTVEYLQKLMLRERVGQIPVLENDEIIGVVTRTDLIALWSQQGERASQAVNLRNRLQATLPAAQLKLLEDAGQEADKIGCSLYIVGGFARDLLLKRPVLDIDLVVEGNAIKLAKAMQAKYGGRIRSHSRFGTANWILEGEIEGVERLDFVTARTEFYRHPTVLPEVEQSSIKQDLHRRDFTINTLAIRLSPEGFGDLLDFYGGYNDLQNKHIRVLHSLSFVEDPTRILRAIRLEQRLDFHLGKRTLEHLKNALDLLPRVSADRIFSELEYTLHEKAPEKALLRLSELGVLQSIHPHLQAGERFVQQAISLREDLRDTPWASIKAQMIHYLGLLTFPLSTEDAEQLIQRLRIRSDLASILRQIQAIKKIAPQLAAAQRPSQVYALLEPYKDDALLVCWLAFDDAAARQWLATFKEKLCCAQPIIGGQYLIEEFGLRPSPVFTTILTILRNARLDGEISTLKEEEAMVEAFLRNHLS